MGKDSAKKVEKKKQLSQQLSLRVRVLEVLEGQRAGPLEVLEVRRSEPSEVMLEVR